MVARPRTAPLLFGSLLAGGGIGSFLVETGATSWPIMVAIAMISVGLAALAGVAMREQPES